MKREEAQFILSAYRPSGEDATSPDFGEALQMAENDPSLSQWFANEQTMDRFVSEKLRQVAPPADLRDRILAGGRVSRQLPWYRSVKIWALAAVLVLTALLATTFLRPTPSPDLGAFAMNYVNSGFDLEAEGNDLSKLQSWLQDRKMPTPGHVPVNLANLEKLGCRTANFQGKNVSIICFKGDKEYHLFVVRKSDFPDLALASALKIGTSGKWASATWSDAEHDYALVSEAGPEAIQRLL